jgi:hypothetical protein
MKNSTLIILIMILSLISTLIYYLPYVFAFILVIVFIIYLILGVINIIPKKYNIFHVIINIIVSFFKWVDSKPRIIKPLKKNWRTPENWDSEV